MTPKYVKQLATVHLGNRQTEGNGMKETDKTGTAAHTQRDAKLCIKRKF